LPFLGIFINW